MAPASTTVTRRSPVAPKSSSNSTDEPLGDVGEREHQHGAVDPVSARDAADGHALGRFAHPTTRR